eukprot:COSAG01_NODE_7_length_54400_cov_1218.054935_36_plen_339_part_00
MSFENPGFLNLLYFIPLLGLLWFYLQNKNATLLETLIPKSRWPQLIPGLSFTRRRNIYLLHLLTFTFIIIAAAGPQYGYKTIEKSRKGANLLIALDTSKSMLARDVLPSRFSLAKQEIKGLISQLQGDQIGLLLFAGESFVQCPLTLDYSALHLFLESSQVGSIPKTGSNLAKAIRKARLHFRKYTSGQNILIIFTDGENFEHDPVESAKVANKEKIKIFTIGVGKNDGEPIPIFNDNGSLKGYKKDKNNNTIFSKLNEQTLKKIASTSNGTYLHLNGQNSINSQLYRHLSKIEKTALKSYQEKQHVNRYQLPLFLALFSFLLSLCLREQKKTNQDEK